MSKSDLVKPVLSYNPDTEETAGERLIFGGNPRSDLNHDDIKYKWAVSLLENVMEAKTWFTSEVPLKEDKHMYPTLTVYEKNTYDKALAQITMMDTFQSANISENVLPYVSAPEIRACLTRQAWEESLHSKSYAVITSTVCPDSDDIFSLYKTDSNLREKNDNIVEIFNNVSSERTEENTYLSYIANIALEGIFFQSAFACFYALALSGKMTGTAEMIRLIARDEESHLALFKNMVKATQKERPYLKQDAETTAKAIEIIKSSVDLEIAWASYITSGKVLGLSPEITSQYIRYLANEITTSIGYGTLYPEIDDNPMKWISDFKPNSSKSNFFEAQVTDYSHGNLLFDWTNFDTTEEESIA